MWSVLVAAWHVVARRALSDRAIPLAAFITVGLATTLLTSAPIYADAVTSSVVRRTLADADVTQSNVAVTVRVTPSTFESIERHVREETARSLSPTGWEQRRRGTSDSFALNPEPTNDLVVFRFFDGIREHASLTAGAWPRAALEPYEVALSEAASIRLGLRVGDQMVVTSRRDATNLVSMRVAGIYSIDDPLHPYWYDDELDTEGISVGVSFTEYGPLVVTRETFFAISPGSSEIQWRFYPEFDNLLPSELETLRSGIESLETRLNRGRDVSNLISVDTGLVELVRDMERSLLATRSTTLTLALQLALVAGYALVLTAGLLAESRSEETDLLRARGTSRAQLLAIAGMEGALLTLPAVVLGPILASWALRGFNYAGPLAGIGLVIAPIPTSSSYLLATAAGVACVGAFVLPTHLATRRAAAGRAGRARPPRRRFAQRAGVDIALLGVAVLAYLQLRRYGAPITESVQGTLGIDPLLVAAPALGLLAGALVALRILPLILRFAEAIMSRGRQVLALLGTWQLVRRPRQYTPVVLLLILATGIGVFGVSYATTWSVSQRDRATFETGADFRVEPDARGGVAIPPHVVRDAYLDLPGFEDAVPVLRSAGRISRTTVRYVVLDANRAADTMAFRTDLATAPVGELLDGLISVRAGPWAVALPGDPTRLAADVTLEVEPLPDEPQSPGQAIPSRSDLRLDLRAYLLDGEGQILRFSLGRIAQTAEPVRLEVDLAHTLADGTRLTPSYPLALVGLEVYSATPRRVVRHARLTIEQVATRTDHLDWSIAPLELGAWEARVSDPLQPVQEPSLQATPHGDEGIRLDLVSGSTASEGLAPAFFTLRPGADQPPAPLPILVSTRLSAETGAEVGDLIPLDSLTGYQGSGVVVGVVDGFPTVTNGSGEPVVLDYQTYLAATFRPGFAVPVPDEYWIAVEDAVEEHALTALRTAPLSSARVLGRTEREVALLSDPVALGGIGSLMLGFVAAAILAGIGFAVSLAVSARQRLGEFALMRAVGLSTRQLIGWLSLESGALVAFGLLVGTLVGLVLSSVALPLIAVTREGLRAAPGVIASYPWASIVLLNLVVSGILAALAASMTRTLRRMEMGPLLRLGDE